MYGTVKYSLLEPLSRWATVTRSERWKPGGKTPSFMAFIIGCEAKVADEEKLIQAYRGRGKRPVLFNDVDVTTILEA